MRAMTDILGLTTIATLYQAGNGIYEQFDKVLILDEGKQVYYGPRAEAVPFMNPVGLDASTFAASSGRPASATATPSPRGAASTGRDRCILASWRLTCLVGASRSTPVVSVRPRA